MNLKEAFGKPKLIEGIGQKSAGMSNKAIQKLPIRPKQKNINERPQKSYKFKKVSNAFKKLNYGNTR